MQIEPVSAGGDVAWQTQLRAKGHRLTPQRQLVLQAVAEIGHATPEQVLGVVHRTATGVNVSTVYRTLDLLEELGLVRHTHLGHGASTYSVVGGDDHLHLVCRDCARVQEVGADLITDLVRRLAAEMNFAVDVGHVSLFGRCAECQALPPK
ncbi:MAG: transcriptional repressor [Mycobacteriales bacterium]